MNKYHLTITGFSRGLNQVLSGVHFDWKTKKVFNTVKAENDKICIWGIRQNKALRNVTIQHPIVIHYKVYWKDKKSDRMNIGSAFDKSFQDALQKMNILKNDGWNDVINATFDFDIDRENPRIEVIIEELKEPIYEVYDWKSLGL